MIGATDPSGRAETDRPPIDLRPLFAPRSIAVVGASPRSDLARTVRDNLAVLGSATRCHFVNPRYDEAWGQPCYPELAALPEVPDAVLLAVNPLRATALTREAADVGVKAVLIPGGGVVEGGEAAAAMQREVRDIAIRHGLAVIGPNCMGMVDLTTNSALYIGDVNPWLPRGGVAGIAQSGSVTDAFIHSGTRIGFSRIVGSGAEVVLDVCDYVAHSLEDPETHTIILFVEGFKRPERFLALADRALELGKPILAVKVGRSSQAQEAAIAHSGSIAGEDRVTDAALAAAGVVRCADLDELLEAAELHAGCRRLGRSVGRGRTGVVTVSTGEASLIADLAEETGLDLPPVPEPARRAILRDLPTMGYIGNPHRPVGRGRRGGLLPGRDARFRRVGRLRRPRDRPRLPVPLAAGRGRGCPDRHPLVARRDPGSTGHPAGLHLVDERASRRPRSRSSSTGPAACRSCAARGRPSWRSRAVPGGRPVERPAWRTARPARRGRRWRPTGRGSATTRSVTRTPPSVITERPRRRPGRCRRPTASHSSGPPGSRSSRRRRPPMPDRPSRPPAPQAGRSP